MTHKDYIAIARVFSANMPNHASSVVAHEMWRALQRDIADILAQDNEFDAERFLSACVNPWY